MSGQTTKVFTSTEQLQDYIGTPLELAVRKPDAALAAAPQQ